AAVEDALAEARDRGRRGLHQQVVGVARIPRYFEGGAASPELGVKAYFEFLDSFRPQVRRSCDPLKHRPDVAADHHARGVRELVSELGQVAGFAVGPAQLDLASLSQQ